MKPIPSPEEAALREALHLAIRFCENPANRRSQTLLQQCRLLDRLRSDLLAAAARLGPVADQPVRGRRPPTVPGPW